MTKLQFSKHFDPSTDNEYKNAEFERCLAEFMVGIVQCYPGMIEKSVVDGVEVWLFKFESI